MEQQKSTFLKVMAIICLVFGIIEAVFGVLLAMGGGLITSMVGSAGTQLMEEVAGTVSPEEMEAIAEVGTAYTAVAGAVLLAAAVVMIFAAIIMILSGVFGMQASKNVAKIKRAIIMGIIMLALQLISLIMGIVGGNFQFINLLGFIIPVLYLLAAFMFKKKAA